MYYTGINPLTMKPVYVATDYHEKQLQRALLQYNRPQNAALVREALQKAGREDLIGYGKECLVRPSENRSPNQGRSNAPTKGISQKPKKASEGRSGKGSAAGKHPPLKNPRMGNKPSDLRPGRHRQRKHS